MDTIDLTDFTGAVQPVLRCPDDAKIWNDVYVEDEYQLIGENLDGLCVLDIGGHIGSFAAKAISHGAATVISIEPNKSNCVAYRQNLNDPLRDGRAVLLPPCACWSDSSETLTLVSCPKDGATSGDTVVLHTGAGTKIRTVSLNDLIRVFYPDAIKIDCEGAEYAILETVHSLPSFVKLLWVEFHEITKLAFRLHRCHSLLTQLGFESKRIKVGEPRMELWRYRR
jgi:FkbM family methyltransferase